MPKKEKVNRLKLKRKKIAGEDEEHTEEEPTDVSAGVVGKVIDLAFNPSREKIREVTIVDRMQGRLFPLLDVVNKGQQHILEIALYRQDKKKYEEDFGKKVPVLPNFLDELMYRTAQWQKSIAGKNLERAIDIALAETEAKAAEEEEEKYGIREPWAD